MTFAGYIAQKDARRLIERYLEIVGEALRRFELAEPAAVPRIPDLRQWVNLRNAIVHGYDSIDDEIIWRVCQDSTPLLRTEIELWLGESEL